MGAAKEPAKKMRMVLREKSVKHCHLDRSRSHAKRDEAQWRDPEGRGPTTPPWRLFGDAADCESYEAKATTSQLRRDSYTARVTTRRFMAEVPADGMEVHAT